MFPPPQRQVIELDTVPAKPRRFIFVLLDDFTLCGGAGLPAVGEPDVAEKAL